MKPRIFIGSSSEGLPIAEEVKKLLEEKAENDCVIWNDGKVFKNNESYLDSLLKAGSMFDFGIMVGTKDDKTRTKGVKTYSIRDNVLFEFGLFMGRLGKFRTLILLEEGAKKPSDIEGIHISNFTRKNDDKMLASIKKAVEIIRDHIEQRYKLPELGLLPSTSVAAGFYENFVKRVCDYLRLKDSVEIEGHKYTTFEIQVVIPSKLQHNMQNSADDYFKVNGFKAHPFEPVHGRVIRTRIAPDPGQPDKLNICDIPTTLTAVYDSIEMYLPKGFGPDSKEFELIEAREIYNFKAVLRSKLKRDPFSKRTVKFIDYDF